MNGDALTRLYDLVCTMTRSDPPTDVDAMLWRRRGDRHWMEQTVVGALGHGQTAVRALAALRGESLTPNQGSALTSNHANRGKAGAIALVSEHVRDYLNEGGGSRRTTTRTTIEETLRCMRPDPRTDLGRALDALFPLDRLTVWRIQRRVRGASLSPAGWRCWTGGGFTRSHS